MLAHRAYIIILFFIVMQFVGSKGSFVLNVFVVFPVELVVFYINCNIILFQVRIVFFAAVTGSCCYNIRCDLIFVFKICEVVF